MKRFLAILPLLLAARIVAAQSAGAQALVLFENGKKLMTQDSYAEACAMLEAALKLEPTTNTVAVLANCREKNNELASAKGLYDRAVREMRNASDPKIIKLRETMQQRSAKLDPRMSKLTIRVLKEGRPPGLEILRGDEHVDAAAWNLALPVDGGTYKISARAPDRREWTTTVQVKPEGDLQVVDVPMLVSTMDPMKEPPKPAPNAAPKLATPDAVLTSAAVVSTPASRNRRDLRVPLYVGAGVLAAGAIGVELWGRATYSDARAAPIVADQERLWHAANNRRAAAIAIGLGSLACLGTSIALRLLERPAPIAPAMTRDSIGAAYTRSW
jgi:tetratricopeptide (TPR) repeat protein